MATDTAHHRITLRPSTPLGWRGIALVGIAFAIAVVGVAAGVAPYRLDGKILIAGDGLLALAGAGMALTAMVRRGDRSLACALAVVPCGFYGLALFLEGARLME